MCVCVCVSTQPVFQLISSLPSLERLYVPSVTNLKEINTTTVRDGLNLQHPVRNITELFSVMFFCTES